MKNTSTVRRYHVWCLAVRLTVFALLVWYAVTDHAAFLQDLTVPRPFSPVTAAWGLLMLSMVLRLFPSGRRAWGARSSMPGTSAPPGRSPPGRRFAPPTGERSGWRCCGAPPTSPSSWPTGQAGCLPRRWSALPAFTAYAISSASFFTVLSSAGSCTSAAAPPAASMTGTI